MTVPKGSLPFLVVRNCGGVYFKITVCNLWNKELKIDFRNIKKIDQKLKDKEKKEFNSNL